MFLHYSQSTTKRPRLEIGMVRTGRFDHDGVAYSLGDCGDADAGGTDPGPLRTIGSAYPSS